MKRQHPTDPNLFWCPKCRSYKDNGDFSKTKQGNIKGYCKDCSAITQRDYYIRRRGTSAVRNHKKAKEKICAICGNQFEGYRSKYCSVKCRKSYEHRPKYNRWCVVCGKYFMAKYIKSKTCSNECYRQFNFGSKIEKTCPVCGQVRIVYQTKRHIDKPNNGICCERCKSIGKRRDQWSKDSQAVNDRYVKDTLRRYKKTITPETIELKRQQIIMIRTLKQFKQWRKENENESNYTDVYGKQRADEENHEGRISA